MPLWYNGVLTCSSGDVSWQRSSSSRAPVVIVSSQLHFPLALCAPMLRSHHHRLLLCTRRACVAGALQHMPQLVRRMRSGGANCDTHAIKQDQQLLLTT